MTLPSQDMMDRFDKEFQGEYMQGNLNLFDVKDFLLQETQRVAKAFGGCTQCYGKGYATVSEHVGGTDEWTHENFNWKLNPIRPCECDRGKQIAKILSANKLP